MHSFQYSTRMSQQPMLTIEMHTDADSIADIIAAFKSYLLAVGFHPNNVKEYLGE